MSSCYNCTGLLETGQKPGYFQLPLFRVVGQFLLIRQAAPSRSELPGSPLTATPVSNASFHGNADVATLRGARNPLSERHAYGLYSSTGPKYWYVQSWALALPVHFHTQRILRWATPFGDDPRHQTSELARRAQVRRKVPGPRLAWDTARQAVRRRTCNSQGTP